MGVLMHLVWEAFCIIVYIALPGAGRIPSSLARRSSLAIVHFYSSIELANFVSRAGEQCPCIISNKLSKFLVHSQQLSPSVDIDIALRIRVKLVPKIEALNIYKRLDFGFFIGLIPNRLTWASLSSHVLARSNRTSLLKHLIFTAFITLSFLPLIPASIYLFQLLSDSQHLNRRAKGTNCRQSIDLTP